jgi:hypothetical protein
MKKNETVPLSAQNNWTPLRLLTSVLNYESQNVKSWMLQFLSTSCELNRTSHETDKG